ncbi:tRNA (adenosine(37)-N6)-threonylcarbamoyltransferase complex dimerization subunit type 1 TsaB [Paenibacillus sp. FSL W7-1287]|uniref:tRNA (adenosine(37)-N6)-threonylcarbamoyltransferase complex dimerization subunit type 1 TsaB n=1 Tax=Paenibacillus sp. FSL W7-1287 TaxID=2954538 RepID=UPI0030F7A52E
MNKQSTVMAIDTSTATMAGAVLSGQQLLAQVQTEAERNHSIHIMTNIEAMLKEGGLKLTELDGIVTGIGPGSYTGVRIAVTAAKTLAWTTAKPLIGISSLAALAISGVMAEPKRGSALIIPIMDARRGQVYTAAFLVDDKENSSGQRLHKDHIVMMEQWCTDWSLKLDELKSQGIETVLIVGDVDKHEESIVTFQASAATHGIQVVSSSQPMNGRALAELGRGEWLAEERTFMKEAHELVPNYAQLTEAEVKQNAKEQGEGK